MTALTEYNITRCGYLCPCKVRADGTFEYGPRGFECNKLATGRYEIVHNVGRTAYYALPGLLEPGSNFRLSVQVESINDNSVTIHTSDGVQLMDADFVVLMIAL